MWFFAFEVFPKISPDQPIMTGEWNIAVAGFTSIGKESLSDKRNQIQTTRFRAGIDVIVVLLKDWQGF